MENPDWVLEPEFPDKHKATHGYGMKDEDILGLTWRPFHLPTQSWVDEHTYMVDNIDTTNKTRHRNIAHGE
ncbi:hypothetical protein ACP4OV_014688 [Aristida adscensionis]